MERTMFREKMSGGEQVSGRTVWGKDPGQICLTLENLKTQREHSVK